MIYRVKGKCVSVKKNPERPFRLHVAVSSPKDASGNVSVRGFRALWEYLLETWLEVGGKIR